MKQKRSLGQLPNYLEFFGFSKAPFGLSPDPEFFFPSEGHYSAKSVLSYTIGSGEGFMALIGEAGTGKTLLLRMLLKEVGKKKTVAAILCPSFTPSGILHMLLKELGETPPIGAETAALYTMFEKKLLVAAKQGKEILIVVDEAQNLPVETMEQLRMLSNIELSYRKLLQIVLIGQPALDSLLRHPQLGQLTQRIVVYEHLYPFTEDECVQYVNHRLAKAGRGDLAFGYFARKYLYHKTGGIPRLINRLMDRALLFAGADNASGVGLKHVRKAAETFPEDHFGSAQYMMLQTAGGTPVFRTCATLLLIVAVTLFII